MSYSCSICGQAHDDMPALAFDSPHNYHVLSEEDKEAIAELTDDFCVIEHEGQTDYFIRAALFQEIADSDEMLHYGVWVSLSEKSFRDYEEHFEDDEYEATYFGYLCSQVAPYADTMSIKMNVVCSGDGHRPEVIPHRSEQMHLPFVRDYYEGISREEADRRVHAMLAVV